MSAHFIHLKVMLICKEESMSLYKDIDDVMVNCRFATMYCDRAQTALPYAMNSEFSKVLAGQMVSNNGCSLHYWFIYNSEFLIFDLAVDFKRDCVKIVEVTNLPMPLLYKICYEDMHAHFKCMQKCKHLLNYICF